MVIDTYLAESVLLRTLKLAGLKGQPNVQEQVAMCQIFIHDAADRIHKNAKEAVTLSRKATNAKHADGREALHQIPAVQ
ncbi:MAG: hypothetical protein LKM36_08350 [Flavobacteriales bacterium]|jgi:hypothetical protein|nr:hypothetical protein [Flavobacteriales bacterium]